MALTWTFSDDQVGYKNVYASLDSVPVQDIGTLVKYDGSIMGRSTYGGALTAGTFAIGVASGVGRIYMAISDSESGWGETYTPSSAEIAALISYGYKMNNGTFGTPYNGTGTKTWTRWDATDNTGAVTTVPTTLASGYLGYELSYQLAETVQEACEVEGSLSLVEGGNQLELSQGIVVRETANPVLYSGIYYINDNSAAGGLDAGNLNFRESEIIEIYKNGLPDTDKWTIFANSSAYGIHIASIPEADFDSSATYAVTYKMLDTYANTANATDATIEYSTSDHSVLGQVVQKQSDIETTTTVNKNAIVDLYIRIKALGG
jgi:hypothetical protein